MDLVWSDVCLMPHSAVLYNHDGKQAKELYSINLVLALARLVVHLLDNACCLYFLS